jgi:hypothetical protein
MIRWLSLRLGLRHRCVDDGLGKPRSRSSSRAVDHAAADRLERRLDRLGAYLADRSDKPAA